MRQFKNNSAFGALGAAALTALTALPALAQEATEAAAEAAPVMDKGDVSWMMVSTVLVLFMTIPGLRCSMAAWCAPRTCCRS